MKQSDRGLGPRLEERAGERSARAAGALASGGYTFDMESTRSAAFKIANMVMLVLFVVAAWMAALAVIARRERRPHARRVDAAGLV